MLSRFLAIIVSSILIISASARSFAWVRSSPREIVERFCEMDKTGKLLSSAGRNEIADLFVPPVVWSPNQAITVISGYSVRGTNTHGKSAQFMVVYHVWGEIDSTLRFTREEGAIANKPIENHKYYLLDLTNKHYELGNNGSMVAVEEPLQWRIGSAGLSPMLASIPQSAM